jgi:hypothetical protein
MIVFQFLGGLGNQMFEYALYYSFQNKGINCKIDLSIYEQESTHNGYELERIFKINGKYCSSLEKKYSKLISKLLLVFLGQPYKEKPLQQYLYNPKIERIRIGFLKGYWQTEKYFLDIEKDLRKKFIFPELNDYKNINVAKEIGTNNSISLHIRRGDYLLGDRDCSLSINYYQKAISYINAHIDNPYFYVFSDNIEWAKENIKDINATYIDWNKKDKSYIDMQLMSMCNHNIIANSSFSWWGAWLNIHKDKIVIAPEKWMPHTNIEIDLLPEKWIKIKNEF